MDQPQCPYPAVHHFAALLRKDEHIHAVLYFLLLLGLGTFLRGAFIFTYRLLAALFRVFRAVWRRVVRGGQQVSPSP